jgi:hypothetical protein
MTVEGPYQNIRRFLRELETSSDFIVLSNIELQAAERQKSESTESLNTEGASAARVGPTIPANSGKIAVAETSEQDSVATVSPGGKTRGEIVSLRLEMAAYFRRSAK